MTWANHYNPPDLKYWHGREDTPANACFFQIMQALDLTQSLLSVDKPAFCLLGFRCDEGIRRNFGRVGAAEGPLAIRDALAKLPVHKSDFLCFDAGDIICSDGNLENAQVALAQTVSLLLKAHMTPIILGGGHELAWGHYQGIAQAYPQEKLGIINFDAHFDMRPLLPEAKGSSGTPFLQIAQAHEMMHRPLDYNCIGIQPAGNIQPLFATAKHYYTQAILADDLHQGANDKNTALIKRVIDENQLIYLSLCLDVFAAPYAPGVSAPQALGVTPAQILPLVRQLAASGKVISYDIAEMSPKYDMDQRTAKLAASFIYEIMHHHATTHRKEI